MQKVIILHGCPESEESVVNPEKRTFDKHWIPWTAQQLRDRGYDVETPVMPRPWAPSYDVYASLFNAMEIPEDAILIGHSCGAAFLVRWLGDTRRHAAKLILVAPWKIPDPGQPDKEAFYVYPIDETIPSRVGDIVIFTSDNEEEDGKVSAKLFHDALGGKMIELPGHGHYVIGDMGTEEFPELVEEVMTIHS